MTSETLPVPALSMVQQAKASHRAGVEHLQWARDCGHDTIRLYAGRLFTHLIDWYGRNGYEVERIEQMPDHGVAQVMKTLRRKEAP